METEGLMNVRKIISSKNPKLLKWLPRFVLRYLERILHQDDINEFTIKHEHSSHLEYCEGVLERIGVTYSISGLENIPADGKCILVMNHPLGGLDAIVLVDAIKSRRQDLTFIVNDILLHLKPLKDIFVGINKHGKTASKSLAQINTLFASDNCVCIFPAGLVSRRTNGIVSDLQWNKTFIKQAKMNNQVIVPIHIDGQLSNFFYRLSNFRNALGLKVNLEMLYLVNELFLQKGKHIHFTVGTPIDSSTLTADKSDKQWAEWFRNHVHHLPK